MMVAMSFDSGSAVTNILMAPPAWRAPAQTRPQHWPQGKLRPYWRTAAIDAQLMELSSLNENWDGFGAKAINSTAVESARQFLAGTSSLQVPYIMPTPDGTLTLEWDSPNGEAVLELGRTKYSFYLKPITGEPVYKHGDVEALHQVTSTIASVVNAVLFSSANSTRTGGFELNIGSLLNAQYSG